MTASEMCKSKTRHYTKEDAKRMGRKRSGRGLLYYYECEVCLQYHLTKLAEYEGKQHKACV